MSRMTVQGALNAAIARFGTKFLPFADAASTDLPLGRLLRLSLFQVSVGMAAVLLIGTLNRVMIVELGVPAGLVAVMLALPLLFAPLRALIGFRSDTHKSYLGWRRVPYIWTGTIFQWGGLAIMPFALLLLSGDHDGPAWAGPASAALAFLMTGAGMHIVQTAGLALATDISPPDKEVRVVALLSLMLLVGMVVSSLAFGALLEDFSAGRLIQVIQGCAVVTANLNLVALWKQEARNKELTRHDRATPTFAQAWAVLKHGDRWTRRLVAVGLGTVAFTMQDVLLEPYGGQILGLTVAQTTALTAALAGGGVAAFALIARWQTREIDPQRIAAYGATVGIFAFAAVVFAAPLHSRGLFALGAAMIGFGGGLFALGTLIGCVELARSFSAGLVLGAWGAVQATAAGIATAAGGLIRDLVMHVTARGSIDSPLADPAAGYVAVYLIEIVLLFVTLAVIGPLVRGAHAADGTAPSGLGAAGPSALVSSSPASP